MRRIPCITLIAIAMLISSVQAQSGQSCATANQVSANNSLSYSTHSSSGKEIWFRFTAGSPNANISLKTVQFGNNTEHMHEMTLYDGVCGGLNKLAKDELSFVNYADELSIDMNATGLVPGNTYHLKIDRESHASACDKINCTANNSSNPATFDLAVENISILIPLDRDFEKPPAEYTYEMNRGQLVDVNGNYVPQIKMYNNKMNPAVYIGEQTTSFVWAKVDTDSIPTTKMHRVDMLLENGNSNTRIFRTENNDLNSKYYLEHCSKGVTCKESYGRSVSKNVYPNIDMQFSANEKGVKMYFTIHPGGDGDKIELKFMGANAVNITPSGGLEIITTLGKLDFEAAHAYQVNQGGQIVPMPWQAKFIKTSVNKVKLDIRNYAQNMPLFIQIDRGHPQASGGGSDNLEWSTWYGGSGADVAYDVTTDELGNVYVVGTTQSATFPVSSGSFQGFLSGADDAFILKFNEGAYNEWATYYGGTGIDVGTSIAIGSSQNLYITGYSSSTSLPISSTNGVYIQSTNGGGRDAFVVKIDPNKGEPEWATFYGGNSDEKSYAIDVDVTGNIFITGRLGYTTNMVTISGGAVGASGQFPIAQEITDSYFQKFIPGTTNGPSGNPNYDCFIAKFDSNHALVWSTPFGGNDFEESVQLQVDQTSGDVVITGRTFTKTDSDNSTPQCGVPANEGFPLCNLSGSYFQPSQGSQGGNSDAFITKFSNNGELLWSTFFGGNGGETGSGVAISSTGNIYVSGVTGSFFQPSQFCATPSNGGFPLCDLYGGSYTDYTFANAFGDEAYIAKFTSSGAIEWSTFYGGETEEDGFAVPSYKHTDLAIDENDNVYLTGRSSVTSSGNNDFSVFSKTGFYFQGTNNNTVGEEDSYVVSFNASNVRQWATLFGGDGIDVGISLTAFSNEKLFIVGYSDALDFPIRCPIPTNGTPYCQSNLAGGTDAFITRFDISGLAVGITEQNELVNRNMLIYPNPSTGLVNIQFELQERTGVSISIYNLLGELIQSEISYGSFGTFKRQLDFSMYSEGVYLIRIAGGSEAHLEKVIIQY